ncbi:MAG: ExeA family protein [Steroidobacteraceae bacterium]
MYEKFYRLLGNPFALTPDPAYFFLGRQHQRALTLLEYALRQGTCFALISGEIGSGKTTVVNYLLRRVQRGLRVGLMTNTHPGIGSLLPWVMQSLSVAMPRGTTAASDLYAVFAQFLERERRSRRRAVLIIDEAQNLTADALEELRVLSNLNAGDGLVLQTVLVGQPEVRETLRSPRMRQFAQRIAVDCHIAPLTREETHQYIAHRLGVAGGNAGIIGFEACDRVHASTGGVPRLINQVCDTALVYGFAERRNPIDAEIIELVLRDRGEGGLLPLVESPALEAAALGAPVAALAAAAID